MFRIMYYTLRLDRDIAITAKDLDFFLSFVISFFDFLIRAFVKKFTLKGKGTNL